MFYYIVGYLVLAIENLIEAIRTAVDRAASAFCLELTVVWKGQKRAVRVGRAQPETTNATRGPTDASSG